MCKCVDGIEKKLLGTEQKGIKVRESELITAALVGPKFQYRTISEIEVKGADKKGVDRKKIVTMIHSFCPFCGEKYDE